MNSNTSYLLTIAIPTWNRASLLEEALNRIEKQVKAFKDSIEIVISDNASSDNTPEIISGFINRNASLKVISNRQKVNTGYFGNFNMVRQLSSGKYLWILSDDDFIEPGVLNMVMSCLDTSKNVETLFLDYWDTNYKNIQALQLNENIESLINRRAYRLTLISSVIFLNNKKRDEFLIKKYQNNSFWGFLLFLSSVNTNSLSKTISGPSLATSRGEVSFNIFRSWIEDMSQCVEYMKELHLSEKTINSFVNSFLETIVRSHYLNAKLLKKNIKRTDSLTDIEKRLIKHYGEYTSFEDNIGTLIRKNYLSLCIYFIYKKVVSKIRKKLIK